MVVGGWYQEATAGCFPTGGEFEFKPAFPSSTFECDVTYDWGGKEIPQQALQRNGRITRAHCFLIIQRRSRPPSPNTAASGGSTISGPERLRRARAKCVTIGFLKLYWPLKTRPVVGVP